MNTDIFAIKSGAVSDSLLQSPVREWTKWSEISVMISV